MADRRATFGPVVLAGLAGGTLAAVAGAQPWAGGRSGRVDTATAAAATQVGSAQESPLAAALALVVLACFGVLLVTRGVVRRLVAALGGLAAAGLVVTWVVGFSGVQDALGGALRTASGEDTAVVSLTGWYWAAGAGALVALAATAVAVAWAPAWPEMGRRYDAPTSARGAGGPAGTAGAAAGAAGGPAGDGSNLELWKALDEGDDPTAGDPPVDTAGGDDRAGS